MDASTVRRIYRSRDERVLAGVAGGISAYLGVDPAFVRLAFAALSFAGGAGLLVYLLCWVLIPLAPEGWVAVPEARTAPPRVLVAGGFILLGVLFLFRGTGIWPGDSFVWPVLLAAGGLAVAWQRSGEAERASVLAFLRSVRERGLGERGRVGRVALLRVALGLALFAGGIAAFLATNAAGDAARKGFLAILVVLGGLALTFAPWWRRLARDLAEERRQRIRSEERAELAAHLHDSVLQTLALIQRHEEPDSMIRLARRQERELRSWLYGAPSSTNGSATLAGALDQAAAEIEDLYGVRVECVCVGNCAIDGATGALVRAVREAMTNAARLSGSELVSVYLEVEDERITAFVRDRGSGFDLSAVPADRKGLAESIVGRMQRHGGTAAIRTAPGEGTEVELGLPRERGSHQASVTVQAMQ